MYEETNELPQDRTPVPVTKESINQMNQAWNDNDITSQLHQLISMNDAAGLAQVFGTQPIYAHLRSKDGRGPMWWAHEHGRKSIVKLLRSKGVSEKRKDKDGITPLDLSEDDEF